MNEYKIHKIDTLTAQVTYAFSEEMKCNMLSSSCLTALSVKKNRQGVWVSFLNDRLGMRRGEKKVSIENIIFLHLDVKYRNTQHA